MRIGMSKDIKHLVKPTGDLNQPLITISSYPTMSTTVQKEYGLVYHVSNPSTAEYYTKLSLDRPECTESGVLHFDETPLWIEKLAAESAYGTSRFYDLQAFQVPPALRRVWDRYNLELLDESRATVGVLLGTHAVKMLIRYFESRGAEYEVYYEDNSTSHNSQKSGGFPVAIKKFVTHSRRTRVKRI
jgi:hypothetical protein